VLDALDAVVDSVSNGFDRVPIKRRVVSDETKGRRHSKEWSIERGVDGRGEMEWKKKDERVRRRMHSTHLPARLGNRLNLLRRVLNRLNRVRRRRHSSADHDLDEVGSGLQLFSSCSKNSRHAVRRSSERDGVTATASGLSPTLCRSEVAVTACERKGSQNVEKRVREREGKRTHQSD
jgi:hypothetical protein